MAPHKHSLSTSLSLSGPLSVTVQQAAARLSEGGLIIYPTETFYGLGAAVSHPEALERLAVMKGRESEGSKAMPIIVADVDQALALWDGPPPPAAQRLMATLWPGPLTLVLPARPGLPRQVLSAHGVGVRVSSHPIARELARLVGPIVATSANRAGNIERTRVADIDRSLIGSVDAVVDAGSTPGGRSSTVLGFEPDGSALLLRDGAIQKALIDVFTR